MSRRCYVCNAGPGDSCRAVDGQVAECPRPSPRIETVAPDLRCALDADACTCGTYENARQCKYAHAVLPIRSTS